MPRPVDAGSAYLPGLDGLRALAVGLVIAYHVGVPGTSGGLLGVGVFFTLSGFLITTILLKTWDKKNSLGLGTFWIRRARRLLPAVILLLVAVLATVAIVEPAKLGTRSLEAFWALIYVANWATIIKGESYFERFQSPSPFSHLWSLSVEEQFYVLWPLILLIILIVLRTIYGRSAYGREKSLQWAAVIVFVLGALSFVLLASLAVPGVDNTRAYEGTDTRAGGLLWGAALAMVWRPEHWGQPASVKTRAIIDGVGLVGLAGVLYLAATTTEQSMSIYHYGILALTLATCALIVGVSAPETLFAKVFGSAPLRWIGERTYGIYLWHMPIAAFVPRLAFEQNPVLIGLGEVALTVLVASLSWTYVEDPIRRHGLMGALRQQGRRAASQTFAPQFAVATALVFAVALSGMVLATMLPRPSAEELAAKEDPGASTQPAAPQTASASPTATPSATSTPTPKPTSTQPTMSCQKVAHVGDSTSVGLISEEYLPDASQRVDAQYKEFGAKSVVTDIDGARAIEEHYQGHPNGADAVRSLKAKNYKGCWVIALGLNDAATIGNGGTPVTAAMRIKAIMEMIGSEDPVLWVNSISMAWAEQTYSNARMIKWNTALNDSLGTYPNLRVYDWAGDVKKWTAKEKANYFQDDGVHYSTPGCFIRGRAIARALALAAPAGGPLASEKVISAGSLQEIQAPRKKA